MITYFLDFLYKNSAAFIKIIILYDVPVSMVGCLEAQIDIK